MFKRWFAILILLTFSASVGAQPSYSQTQKSDQNQNTEVRVSAIVDATRDANKYNAMSWGVVGVFTTPASIGANLACCMYAPNVAETLYFNKVTCFACFFTIPTLTFLTPYIYKVTPPTERLLGKSPEYISLYVETYTERVKNKRLEYFVFGYGIGTVISGVILVVAAVSILEDVSESIEESCVLPSTF